MLYPRLVASFVQSMPTEVVIDIDGIDEDGAPIEGESWTGSANYQDYVREVYRQDRSETEVHARLYIDGDPFPDIAVFGGGTVTVFGEERSIVLGMKARNPDATVNYTRLDLK